ATFVCREATGVCDVAETCTGTGPDCPEDGFKSATTSCNDDNACTVGDHCSGSGDVCVGGDAAACDGACLTGVCDSRSGCLPKQGAKARTCHVDECRRKGLHRKLQKLAFRIDHAVDLGRSPKRHWMNQLEKLLARCGVAEPVAQ